MSLSHPTPNDGKAPSEKVGETSIAIKAEALSKVYKVYGRPQDRLLQAFVRKRQLYSTFWALRDISFEVGKGETVGIIGRNGSGKSTLLQILCGTLQPSGGEMEVKGRISALLELGSGFNPEFTGCENVFLNSAILGVSEEETQKLYDSIVSFADIGDYIDQPVKTYSSGMVVRLAFSVAINVSPDILVVDEALAVGDEAFQRRCMARIEGLRDSGATILFVSHSARQVVELCDRVILLDEGEKLFEGPPRDGMNYYQKLIYLPRDKALAFRAELKAGKLDESRQDSQSVLAQPNSPSLENKAGKSEDAALAEAQKRPTAFFNPGMISKSALIYDPNGAKISEVRLTTPQGDPVNMLLAGERYELRFTIELAEEAFGIAAGTKVKTLSGIELSGGTTAQSDERLIDFAPAGSKLEARHSFTCNLIDGTYFMNCGVSAMVEGHRRWLHRIVDAVMFQVIPEKFETSRGPIVQMDFDSHLLTPEDASHGRRTR